MFKILFAFLALLPTMAMAQSDTLDLDRKVAERIEQSRNLYGVPDPRLRCRPKPGSDEIVVCVDRGEDQRVDRGAPDPATLVGRRALDGGMPRAPQFDRGYCAQCPHFGSVPPAVYHIDLKAIPEPPAGSDADKIAKGEMAAP